jgi:hypothetical protein
VLIQAGNIARSTNITYDIYDYLSYFGYLEPKLNSVKVHFLLDLPQLCIAVA